MQKLSILSNDQITLVSYQVKRRLIRCELQMIIGAGKYTIYQSYF